MKLPKNPTDVAEASPCFSPALSFGYGYPGYCVMYSYTQGILHAQYQAQPGMRYCPCTPSTFVFFFFFQIFSFYYQHLYCLYRKKWLKNESNKTSSVVGYHIEMPANARLRSSGFVAWEFFFLSGCSEACPKDFSDRTLSNKQRPKKRDDRQGKRIRGACGNLDSQSACLGAFPKSKTKAKTKAKTKK